MSTLSAHNLGESFKLGSVNYNWQGIGTPEKPELRDIFLSSEFVVLMKSETFLDLTTQSLFPTAKSLSALMKEAAEICPPFLQIYVNEDDTNMAPQVIGHEGRNRARAASLIDGENALIPVFIATTRPMTPELFKTLSSEIRQENMGRKVSGVLFKTFFHDTQAWEVAEL